MTATYLETGMARFNRFGLCATTALRTAMVWRAAWNAKEAAEEAEARRQPLLDGWTYLDKHGRQIRGVYPLEPDAPCKTFDGVTYAATSEGVFRQDGPDIWTKIEPRDRPSSIPDDWHWDGTNWVSPDGHAQTYVATVKEKPHGPL